MARQEASPERRQAASPPKGGVDERRRIAGRLHDEVQQLLFGIRLKTTIVRTHLAKQDARAAEEDISDIENWAAEAIRAIQELCAELDHEPSREASGGP
jgi:signal transduction histidine kinase